MLKFLEANPVCRDLRRACNDRELRVLLEEQPTHFLLTEEYGPQNETLVVVHTRQLPPVHESRVSTVRMSQPAGTDLPQSPARQEPPCHPLISAPLADDAPRPAMIHFKSWNGYKFTIGGGQERITVRYIEKRDELAQVSKSRTKFLLRGRNDEGNRQVFTAVSLSCTENSEAGLQLLGLSTSNGTFCIFDWQTIGRYAMLGLLEPMLTSKHVLKVMDCTQEDLKRLEETAGFSLQGVVNVRAVEEWLDQEPRTSIDSLLKNTSLFTHSTTDVKPPTKQIVESSRPIPKSQLEDAAWNVILLQRTTFKLSRRLSEQREDASTDLSEQRKDANN